MSRDRKQTSCVLWGPFADREYSLPMVEPSYEGSDGGMISEAESDDGQLSTCDSISVPEGPDFSMIPDICPSSLSMPSTACSTDSEDDGGLSMKPEPFAEEDTQPKEGPLRESRSDSESEAHDDASVGNGTITTEEDIKLEERSSIGSSHESGETWNPSFADCSWLWRRARPSEDG